MHWTQSSITESERTPIPTVAPAPPDRSTRCERITSGPTPSTTAVAAAYPHPVARHGREGVARHDRDQAASADDRTAMQHVANCLNPTHYLVQILFPSSVLLRTILIKFSSPFSLRRWHNVSKIVFPSLLINLGPADKRGKKLTPSNLCVCGEPNPKRSARVLWHTHPLE